MRTMSSRLMMPVPFATTVRSSLAPVVISVATPVKVNVPPLLTWNWSAEPAAKLPVTSRLPVILVLFCNSIVLPAFRIIWSADVSVMSLPAPDEEIATIEPCMTADCVVTPRVNVPPGVMFSAPVLVMSPPFTARSPLVWILPLVSTWNWSAEPTYR